MESILTDCAVRTLWDEVERKWWFCAVDLCAVLTGRDAPQARKYWKSLKWKWQKHQGQQVTISYRLKMKCQDGKLRYTDVLDVEQVLYLIAVVPSRAAEPYKRWLAEATVRGRAAKELHALGKRNAAVIARETKALKELPTRQVVTRELIVQGGLPEPV